MDSLVIDRDVLRADKPAIAARDRGDAILNAIRAQGILGLLPERDLLALVRQSSTRSLPKNRVLFRSGDEGRSVVLILQGYVKLSTMASNGREVVLEIAGPGTIFGELAVLNDSPRQADATTLTVVPRDGDRRRAVPALARRHPGSDVCGDPPARRSAVRYYRAGHGRVSLPAPVRLAKALLHLAKLHSARVEDGVQIGFRLSQRELGAMTGLIRESINKHLKAWRAAGLGGAVRRRRDAARRARAAGLRARQRGAIGLSFRDRNRCGGVNGITPPVRRTCHLGNVGPV